VAQVRDRASGEAQIVATKELLREEVAEGQLQQSSAPARRAVAWAGELEAGRRWSQQEDGSLTSHHVLHLPTSADRPLLRSAAILGVAKVAAANTE
jgi:hypothetical protein